MQLSWPPLTVGRLIALVVVLACLAAAFVGQVHVVNLDLWLVGGLAVAVLIG